jgi:hypothetical protein
VADNVSNKRLLEHLRLVQEQLRSLTDDMSDVKADVRGMKTHLAGFMQTELAQDGALASLRMRIDRIERRLGLVDPETR